MNKLNLWYLALAPLAGGLLGGCSSAWAPIVAPIVQDVTGAVCKELETQPEPEWVIFTCSLIDPSAKVNEGKPQTFEIKIRRSTLTKELQVTK